MLNLKMALIELLTRYTIEQSSETKVPLELVQGVTIKAKDGVFCDFQAPHINHTEVNTAQRTVLLQCELVKLYIIVSCMNVRVCTFSSIFVCKLIAV